MLLFNEHILWCCAAEPKGVGLIPGRGGRFSDGCEKQKFQCV